MTIQQWWPRLSDASRDWLISNNGDAVPPDIVAEIAAAGGPGAADPWWAAGETDGSYFPDDAVDWIEETANLETP